MQKARPRTSVPSDGNGLNGSLVLDSLNRRNQEVKAPLSMTAAKTRPILRKSMDGSSGSKIPSLNKTKEKNLTGLDSDDSDSDDPLLITSLQPSAKVINRNHQSAFSANSATPLASGSKTGKIVQPQSTGSYNIVQSTGADKRDVDKLTISKPEASKLPVVGKLSPQPRPTVAYSLPNKPMSLDQKCSISSDKPIMGKQISKISLNDRQRTGDVGRLPETAKDGVRGKEKDNGSSLTRSATAVGSQPAQSSMSVSGSGSSLVSRPFPVSTQFEKPTVIAGNWHLSQSPQISLPTHTPTSLNKHEPLNNQGRISSMKKNSRIPAISSQSVTMSDNLVDKRITDNVSLNGQDTKRDEKTEAAKRNGVILGIVNPSSSNASLFDSLPRPLSKSCVTNTNSNSGITSKSSTTGKIYHSHNTVSEAISKGQFKAIYPLPPRPPATTDKKEKENIDSSTFQSARGAVNIPESTIQAQGILKEEKNDYTGKDTIAKQMGKLNTDDNGVASHRPCQPPKQVRLASTSKTRNDNSWINETNTTERKERVFNAQPGEEVSKEKVKGEQEPLFLNSSQTSSMPLSTSYKGPLTPHSVPQVPNIISNLAKLQASIAQVRTLASSTFTTSNTTTISCPDPSITRINDPKLPQALPSLGRNTFKDSKSLSKLSETQTWVTAAKFNQLASIVLASRKSAESKETVTSSRKESEEPTFPTLLGPSNLIEGKGTSKSELDLSKPQPSVSSTRQEPSASSTLSLADSNVGIGSDVAQRLEEKRRNILMERKDKEVGTACWVKPTVDQKCPVPSAATLNPAAITISVSLEPSSKDTPVSPQKLIDSCTSSIQTPSKLLSKAGLQSQVKEKRDLIKPMPPGRHLASVGQSSPSTSTSMSRPPTPPLPPHLVQVITKTNDSLFSDDSRPPTPPLPSLQPSSVSPALEQTLSEANPPPICSRSDPKKVSTPSTPPFPPLPSYISPDHTPIPVARTISTTQSTRMVTAEAMSNASKNRDDIRPPTPPLPIGTSHSPSSEERKKATTHFNAVEISTGLQNNTFENSVNPISSSFEAFTPHTPPIPILLDSSLSELETPVEPVQETDSDPNTWLNPLHLESHYQSQNNSHRKHRRSISPMYIDQPERKRLKSPGLGLGSQKNILYGTDDKPLTNSEITLPCDSTDEERKQKYQAQVEIPTPAPTPAFVDVDRMLDIGTEQLLSNGLPVGNEIEKLVEENYETSIESVQKQTDTAKSHDWRRLPPDHAHEQAKEYRENYMDKSLQDTNDIPGQPNGSTQTLPSSVRNAAEQDMGKKITKVGKGLQDMSLEHSVASPIQLHTMSENSLSDEKHFLGIIPTTDGTREEDSYLRLSPLPLLASKLSDDSGPDDETSVPFGTKDKNAFETEFRPSLSSPVQESHKWRKGKFRRRIVASSDEEGGDKEVATSYRPVYKTARTQLLARSHAERALSSPSLLSDTSIDEIKEKWVNKERKPKKPKDTEAEWSETIADGSTDSDVDAMLDEGLNYRVSKGKPKKIGLSLKGMPNARAYLISASQAHGSHSQVSHIMRLSSSKQYKPDNEDPYVLFPDPPCPYERKAIGKRTCDSKLLDAWNKRKERFPPNNPIHRSIFESYILQSTAYDEYNSSEIRIINDVDHEGPAPNFEFVYSNEMLYTDKIPDPEKGLGCDCDGPCDPESGTCSCVKRQELYNYGTITGFAYDQKGKIKNGTIPIWECSDTCGCPLECPNRVIQRGRDRETEIDIFKTKYKGWGVRARLPIANGTFLGIYSGELITEEESEKRGITYNLAGTTYLFDLDGYAIRYPPEGLEGVDMRLAQLAEATKKRAKVSMKRNKEDHYNAYSVDAFRYGNNHSCDPNLVIMQAYVKDFHPERPLLVIFARRDIKKNEELCISYKGIPDEEDLLSPNKRNKEKGKGGKMTTNSSASVHMLAIMTKGQGKALSEAKNHCRWYLSPLLKPEKITNV
nr:hypothetical protein L204_05945 [Cryptococcus depauperatus CBS 7855]